MFSKTKPKPSANDFIDFKPITLFTPVKYISVDTIDGRHDCYKNAEYRMTSESLIIKIDNERIFYNIDNVVRFSCELMEGTSERIY